MKQRLQANRPMSARELIAGDEQASLGGGIYVAVALSSALLVLAVAGYLAHSTEVEDAYLPADIVAHQQESLSAASVGASPRVDGEGVQIVRIDASKGVFEPNQVVVRAGVPVRLVFTKGVRCTDVVTFSKPEMSVRLDRDGGTLDLPALEAGVYSFGCRNGGASGLVLAE